jgi:hypothetical protein
VTNNFVIQRNTRDTRAIVFAVSLAAALVSAMLHYLFVRIAIKA